MITIYIIIAFGLGIISGCAACNFTFKEPLITFKEPVKVERVYLNTEDFKKEVEAIKSYLKDACTNSVTWTETMSSNVNLVKQVICFEILKEEPNNIPEYEGPKTR